MDRTWAGQEDQECVRLEVREEKKKKVSVV